VSERHVTAHSSETEIGAKQRSAACTVIVT
jgi:hypothetical protein